MAELRFARLLLLGMLCVVFTGIPPTSGHNNNNDVPSHPHPKPQPYPKKHNPSGHFDAKFRGFLRQHGYTGGTVAALKDGRLILAKGYGVTREGTEVKVGSRLPVSSLSQSLTAVAVLRLAQEGKLGLDQTVFGEDGILGDVLKPLEVSGGGSQADPRLQDITVGHLLRHSAGWDHSEAPLFDPVLNEVYQARGYSVPDIAKLTDTSTPLSPSAVIRYVLSRPLHYTPGARAVPSNLGYLVLGRVVERVTGLTYQDYVKRAVLKPCGMWHTRLGIPASQRLRFGHRLDEDVPDEETPDIERRRLDGQLDIFDVLDPLTVDSALGWYSTVFDMARFARCVFDGEDVLNDASLELLLQREDSAVQPSSAPVSGRSHRRRGGVREKEEEEESWLCAGFRSDTRGAVWQDGDPHADDAILFHNLMASRSDNDLNNDNGGRSPTPMPDTWVVLLHGSHLHRLRHETRRLMKELRHAVQQEEEDDAQNLRNGFVRDLSDMDASGAGDAVLVKFRVDEHHLDAYLQAVKEEDYSVRWISPYTTTSSHHHKPSPSSSSSSRSSGGRGGGRRHHTYFAVISRKIVSTTEPEVDYRVEHGLGEKQLLTRKLSMERQGYNLTFLQSYLSQSHHHHDRHDHDQQQGYAFLAVFRKHAYPSDTQLKYGTDHLPEPYDKLVQMYQEQQFHPLVQSVLPRDNGKEEHLSFVFLQTPHGRPVDFKNYYRLSDGKLERAVLNNGDAGRTLSFLDAYRLQGRTRFAAVFTNETRPRWHFQGGLSQAQAVLLMEARLPRGLWPSILVAYADGKDKDAAVDDVKYAVFLRSDEDTRHHANSPPPPPPRSSDDDDDDDDDDKVNNDINDNVDEDDDDVEEEEEERRPSRGRGGGGKKGGKGGRGARGGKGGRGEGAAKRAQRRKNPSPKSG